MTDILYDSFLLKKRIMLDQEYGWLSGGLQPKVLLSQFDGELELITYSNDGLMMGGSFLWEIGYGADYKDYPDHYPYFKRFARLNRNILFPFAEDDRFFVSHQGGFFQILERTSRIHLEINDELSEKYGVGLLESNATSIRGAKIIIKDINQNGLQDVIIGENNWDDYWPDGERWSSKDYIPFDDNRKWRGGPLHGRLYVLLNQGESQDDPDILKFTDYKMIDNIDQYGFCAPTFADFNQNGMQDMISSSFIRDLKFFKRTGNDNEGFPTFNPGVQIKTLPGVINYVINHDLTKNGHSDLLISSENGHVYLLENTGQLDEHDVPLFEDPIPVLQTNPPMKSDILPVAGIGELREGHLDLVCGNGGGFFDYFTDVNNPKYSHQISAIDRILPPQPGGSIQGPSEIGWGYTCATLYDWTQNGLLDLIFSDINGEHFVSVNTGSIEKAKFSSPTPVVDETSGQHLKTVWRVRPTLYSPQVGVIHYYCLDESGRLIVLEKISEFELGNRQYVKTDAGKEITFTKRYGGGRGRIKLCIVDWNKNGIPDILIGFPKSHHFGHLFENDGYEPFMHASIALMKNVGTKGRFMLKPPRYLVHKEVNQPLPMGHHSCSPEVYEYKGTRYVVVGCEDGQFYRFKTDNLFPKE